MLLYFADIGLPTLAIAWPWAWIMLVLIIPLEALVYAWGLKLPFQEAGRVSASANLLSTLVGIPVAWALFLPFTPNRGASPDPVLDTVIHAAWLLPYSGEIPAWQPPLALAVLCVPFCVISTIVEYLFVRKVFIRSWRLVICCAVAQMVFYVPAMVFLGWLSWSRYAIR